MDEAEYIIRIYQEIERVYNAVQEAAGAIGRYTFEVKNSAEVSLSFAPTSFNIDQQWRANMGVILLALLFFLIAEYLPYKLDLEQKIDVWRCKYDDGEISRLGLFFAPVWRYPR